MKKYFVGWFRGTLFAALLLFAAQAARAHDHGGFRGSHNFAFHGDHDRFFHHDHDRFFHGDRDQIIPLKLGRALFDAAPRPKWFCEVSGAGHNDLLEVAGPSYRERLSEFYKRLVRLPGK